MLGEFFKHGTISTSAITCLRFPDRSDVTPHWFGPIRGVTLLGIIEQWFPDNTAPRNLS